MYPLFRCPIEIDAPRAFDRVPEHRQYMTQRCSQQPWLINSINISLRIDKQYTFILMQVNFEGYPICVSRGLVPSNFPLKPSQGLAPPQGIPFASLLLASKKAATVHVFIILINLYLQLYSRWLG